MTPQRHATLALAALLTLSACDDSSPEESDTAAADTSTADTSATDTSATDTSETDTSTADTAPEDTSATDSGETGDTSCTGSTPTATAADFFNVTLDAPNTYALSFDVEVTIDPSDLILTAGNGGAGLVSDLSLDTTGPATTFTLSVDTTSWANGDAYTLTIPASAVTHACGDATLAEDIVVEVNAVDCTSNSPPSPLNDNPDTLNYGQLTYRVTFDERVFGVELSDFSLTGDGSGAITDITSEDRRGYDLTLTGVAIGETYTLAASGLVDSCGDTLTAPTITVLNVVMPAAGETCSEPIALSAGEQTYTFSATAVDHLEGASLESSGCTTTDVLSGPDVVFTWTAQSAGTLGIRVQALSDFIGGQFRVAALLHTGDCASPAYDTCESSYAESHDLSLSTAVNAGDTVYLFVAKTDSSPNTFAESEVTITVTEP